MTLCPLLMSYVTLSCFKVPNTKKKKNKPWKGFEDQNPKWSLGLFKYALNCPYHCILLYVGNANFESKCRFGKWSVEH